MTGLSNVNRAALERAGGAGGIDRATILEAYRIAKATVAVANHTVDKALKVRW